MPSSILIHALHTDRGRVRSHNEDAAAAAPGLGAYVVCDGMGGAAGGEVASRMAIDRFLEHLTLTAAAGGAARGEREGEGFGAERASSGRRSATQKNPQTRLHAAVHAANEAVHRFATERPEYSGMGTTLVALLHVPGPGRERRSTPRSSPSKYVAPPTLFLANVGDSRCYRWRAGELLQLSMDHSFVEEQVLAGQITAAQAETSPMRNYITRAIGPQTHVEPDIQMYRPMAGDVYLLASDGLTRELGNGEIGEILAKEIRVGTATTAELQGATRGLIEAANARGGRDNITVLLLAFL